MPGLPVLVQALLFALFTAAAVGLGRRWYHQSEVPTEDPQLNDRTSRLIGTTAEVCDAITAGEGRVKIGDGAWRSAWSRRRGGRPGQGRRRNGKRAAGRAGLTLSADSTGAAIVALCALNGALCSNPALSYRRILNSAPGSFRERLVRWRNSLLCPEIPVDE